jgi:hypothetical protein
VVVLSREAFDALEFDAACTGDHRAAAEEMIRLADTGMQSATMPRSEAYVRAGEQWLLADEPAAAASGFMRALEDGGPSSTDPRVPLARALFMLGRSEDADALIAALGREAPYDARVCDQVAELLVELADLPGALAWATAGVELCLGRSPAPVAPGEQGAANGAAVGYPPSVPRPVNDGRATPAPPGSEETELQLLLTLRFRIRNDLGLPEDDYDRLLDQRSLPGPHHP